MNIPSFHASEIVKIIGRRQTASYSSTYYDCVCIIPKSCKFSMSDPPIAIPIPSTSTSTAVDTKIVALRRVTRKVTITGIIVDGEDSFSKTGVVLDASSGATSGGSTITSIIKKKWALEEMFNQGAAGEGMTVQWRNVIVPSVTPDTNQTTPPTAPSDETKNMYHKLGKIIDLSITDDADTHIAPQSSAPTSTTRYHPEKMEVSITIQWGSVQA
jgi:hypothetical protein